MSQTNEKRSLEVKQGTRIVELAAEDTMRKSCRLISNSFLFRISLCKMHSNRPAPHSLQYRHTRRTSTKASYNLTIPWESCPIELDIPRLALESDLQAIRLRGSIRPRYRPSGRQVEKKKARKKEKKKEINRTKTRKTNGNFKAIQQVRKNFLLNEQICLPRDF